MARELSIAELASWLRNRSRAPARELVIRCDRVTCIPARDVIETKLALAGVRRWEWVGGDGSRVGASPSLRAPFNVVRDLVSYPILRARREHAVHRLRRRARRSTQVGGSGRVLFLRTDHHFGVKSGGSIGHLRGVIDGLRGLGHKVQVLSSDHLAGIDAGLDFELCSPTCREGRNLPGFPEIAYTDQVLDHASRRWHAWSPDLVYQRYSACNYAGVALKARFGVPFVCEYNGSFVWMLRNWDGLRPFHERMIERIELLNVQAADLVVVVSRAMRDELVRRGVPEPRIFVNPNGVNSDEYSPEVDGAEVRERHGLQAKLVVGFVGTFGPWHGAEVLADAVGLLVERRPEYRDRLRLLLVGDGACMPKVRARIASRRIEDMCVLTGLVPQAQGPAHLAACDVLASPHVPNPDGSPFFGSPTKLFEYMAMGKAVVASSLDQIAEVLEHGVTAWMARPGDAGSLADGLEALLGDPVLRARLGAAARNRAVERHTWRSHVELTMRALQATARPG